VYTNKELVQYTLDVIKEDDNTITLPPPVALGVGAAFSFLPNPWLSADGMRRQSVDIVQPEGSPGFEELGITDLSSVEDIAERYLVRFRKMSMFIDDDTVVKQPR
jgi:hypothetical protein